MSRSIILAVALLALLVDPPRLHGVWMESLPAVRAEPPAAALRHWRELVACTGLRPKRGRGFSTIQWHRVEGRRFIRPDNRREVIGLWLREGNAVVLAGEWWDDGRLIRHELLHVLLQSGAHEHPNFAEARGIKCGLFPG